MLQQTRVETVVPYWERWLDLFPTVEALAQAEEAEVLKAWEGLGYYSRARNLHRGAAFVQESHGGRVPSTAESLRGVPGIGPYTSGAIASIAFGEAVPAVDGNVRRVFARLFDERAPSPRQLEVWGAELVDPDRPGDFNQAVMELGATVCTPRNPACARCPVAGACGAYANGTVAERPAPKKRTKVRVGAFVTRIERDEAGRVRMVRRGASLLQGMWSFPEAEVTLEEADRITVEAGPNYLGAVDHVYSHLRARYHVVRVDGELPEGLPLGEEPAWAEERWVEGDNVGELALSKAQQRVWEMAR